MAAKKKHRPQVVGFLGVGLDNQDGHQRITRGEVGARHTLAVERAGTRRDVVLVLVEQLP